MSFNFDKVVPWGRSYDEYVGMFNLTENDLKQKILGCGDGPASFNYECNKLGGDVISIDPIYSLTKEQIDQRIQETYNDVLNQVKQNKDKFVWDTIKSVDELGEIRMNAMRLFLDSYDEGKENKKYLAHSLPYMPFNDNSFDVAVCSHFLFLYTDNLSYEFHVDAIAEMLRVSGEVRIFPLLDVNAKSSPYVDRIINNFSAYSVKIHEVNYEFQRGGNKMLRICKFKRRIQGSCS